MRWRVLYFRTGNIWEANFSGEDFGQGNFCGLHFGVWRKRGRKSWRLSAPPESSSISQSLNYGDRLISWSETNVYVRWEQMARWERGGQVWSLFTRLQNFKGRRVKKIADGADVLWNWRSETTKTRQGCPENRWGGDQSRQRTERAERKETLGSVGSKGRALCIDAKTGKTLKQVMRPQKTMLF